MMSTLGERIKEIRDEAGLSQRAFARMIGIGGSAIAMLEADRNVPREQTVRAICDQFNISRLWLETGKPPKQLVAQEDKELVDKILHDNDPFVRAFILGVARTPGGWEKMYEIFSAVKEELDKQSGQMEPTEEEK